MKNTETAQAMNVARNAVSVRRVETATSTDVAHRCLIYGNMTMARTKHHGYRKKYDLFGDEWNWNANEPKYWRRLYKHKKRRAEWRHKQAQIKNGADLDNMVYPKDRQPWIYYW